MHLIWAMNFLRSAIRENDYKARGVDIALDEIFISDGAKSDSGNIGDIFAENNRIAVCDPVYLYMLTQTLWQEEQENSLRKLKAGAM